MQKSKDALDWSALAVYVFVLLCVSFLISMSISRQHGPESRQFAERLQGR